MKIHILVGAALIALAAWGSAPAASNTTVGGAPQLVRETAAPQLSVTVPRRHVLWTGRASWRAQSLAQRHNLIYTALGNYASISLVIKNDLKFVPGSANLCRCQLTIDSATGAFVWLCPCIFATGSTHCIITSGGCTMP